MPTPNELRKAVADLAELARRDLAEVWRQFGDAKSQQARDALMDILPLLVQTYGEAAATVAADWYDELRDEAAAAGRFTAIPAEIPDAGTSGLVGWAMETAKDDETFRSLIDGGTQKRIANASRYTVARSSVADPQSVGWKRIGSGACAFCRMLIERDQLYSEATADFASHDHCNCQAYPLIKGAEPIDVKDYTPGPRHDPASGRYQADYERARKWLADHPSA